MFLVDSHCHISDLNFREQHESFEDAYKNAMAAGVTHMLNICCELPSFQKMAADSAPYANVWLTAGTHPENISAEWTEELTLDRPLTEEERAAILPEEDAGRASELMLEAPAVIQADKEAEA